MSSCYSELPRPAVYCRQFTVVRRHKKLFYHLVGFRGREKERGSEKEINKKINSVWLMVKIRPLIYGVL